MNNLPKNMRGIRDGFIVTVLEGKGTDDNRYRKVNYVYTYTNDGSPICIGALDPAGIITHWDKPLNNNV